MCCATFGIVSVVTAFQYIFLLEALGMSVSSGFGVSKPPWCAAFAFGRVFPGEGSHEEGNLNLLPFSPEIAFRALMGFDAFEDFQGNPLLMISWNLLLPLCQFPSSFLLCIWHYNQWGIVNFDSCNWAVSLSRRLRSTRRKTEPTLT